jgi:hypothetical protein
MCYRRETKIKCYGSENNVGLRNGTVKYHAMATADVLYTIPDVNTCLCTLIFMDLGLVNRQMGTDSKYASFHCFYMASFNI